MLYFHRSSDSAKMAKSGKGIEALSDFRKLRESWPEDMSRLFDPKLSEERRGELWESMCEGGEKLRQRYVLQHRHLVLWTRDLFVCFFFGI